MKSEWIEAHRLRTQLVLLLIFVGIAAVMVVLGPSLGPADSTRESAALPTERMAAHIIAALDPVQGERVLLRYDPEIMPELEAAVRQALEAGGVKVQSLAYGPAPGLAQRLEQTDVYIWLPASSTAATPPDQRQMLSRWLSTGKGRQIHFHWGDGTRGADGVEGEHSGAYDRVYVDALDIDYEELDRRMNAAIRVLRSGEIRVTTPAGTDLRFRVGDRPFNKQNGDASPARMAGARIAIDYEIELPAGALRVAPLEESVNGTLAIPRARINGTEVKGVRLTISRGVVTEVAAQENQVALESYLDSSPLLKRVRGFAIGFNPKLVQPEGEPWIPYYGYGAGVVRLSLGGNTELGGGVEGGDARWFFFTDASVRVGEQVLVAQGRLQQMQ